MTKKQLTTKEDITFLVDAFYTKVLQDEKLSPFFEHLNFEKHKPRMVHFWTFVLLDEAGYTTDVTKKHMHMPLKQEHFDRWIALFEETLHYHFEGEKVEQAIQRAKLVGRTIKSKLR